MSRFYGTLFQQGYVVQDIDAAVAHWAETCGIGPFFIYPTPIPFQVLKIWDKPVEYQIHKRVVMAYSGEIQIELIETTADPSPYRDFLDKHGAGLQHFGFFADDFDAQLAAAEARGMVRAMEGKQALSRMCYLWNPKEPDAPMMEMVELKPERRAVFDKMRDAARGWDGTNPIRNL